MLPREIIVCICYYLCDAGIGDNEKNIVSLQRVQMAFKAQPRKARVWFARHGYYMIIVENLECLDL